MALLSLVLLSKVVDKINLDTTSNDWLHVGGFFGALVIFLFACWMILYSFILAPFESFGHRLFT